VVWTPELRTNLTQELAPFTRSEFLLTDGYLINLFEKTAEVPLRFFAADGLRQHNFQRAVLRAMRVD
jgi:hypothetical protein